MRAITAKDAEENGVRTLGLDGSKYDFMSVEGLSALIRRCGAFVCPCSPTTLINAVLLVLDGVRDEQEIRDQLSDLLEQIVAYGDFIEAREISGNDSHAKIFYVAPPAFVEISEGHFLLLGIAPDDGKMLPTELHPYVVYKGHAKFLALSPHSEGRRGLLTSGFREISSDEWLKAPIVRKAADQIKQYDSALSSSTRPGALDDLLILNPESSVRFYKSRWEPVKRQTGRFVARRPQPYGAQLWAVVQLSEGRLIHLLDLPHVEKNWRACDEAWHLQQAFDAARGLPQQYRVFTANDFQSVVDFFAPIPAWAQRRWDCVGRRVPGFRSLLSYEFQSSSLQEELRFARERMWLNDTEGERS